MPHYDWVDDGYFVTETRDFKQIRRVLIVTMLLNFVAMGLKLVTGYLAGALSVVADGLDSFFDGLSNVIGLAGLYAAAKPPDAEHPYGHRKVETIAALSIAYLLFLTCWQLLQSAWWRFGETPALVVNSWTIGAILVSILIQAATSAYELREGKRLNSEVLIADALHTRANILVSASVLGGLGLVQLGYSQADTLLAVVVALIIAKIGVDILRETVPVLIDQAAIDPRIIAEIVKDVNGVESFHRVRSRGTPDSAAVDLHVRIAPEKTIQKADAIAHEVRRRLLELETISDVTVHLEAQRNTAATASDILGAVRQAAGEMGLVVHECEVQQVESLLFLDIHIGVEPSLALGEAHALVEQLEREMYRRSPEISKIHTHIEMASQEVLQRNRAPLSVQDRVEAEASKIVEGFPALTTPHNIMVKLTPGETNQYFISLDCNLAEDMPVTEAHSLATELERELSRSIQGVVDVSVHLEPPSSNG